MSLSIYIVSTGPVVRVIAMVLEYDLLAFNLSTGGVCAIDKLFNNQSGICQTLRLRTCKVT